MGLSVHKMKEDKKKAIKNDREMRERYNSRRKYNIKEKIKNRNSWLLVFVVVVFTLSVCSIMVFKFIFNNEKFEVDLASVLSTLLAFFSIFLSALFYFKATEQSNTFYDRSYNHTKDIAESLSGMRGEFGKSLDFLEKNSDAMNQRFDSLPLEEISETKKRLEKVEKEKEDSLKKMLEEAGVEQGKQTEYIQKLNKQEKHINDLNYELNKLKHVNNLKQYITNCLIEFIFEFGPNELIEAEANTIVKKFQKFRRVLSDDLIMIFTDEKIIDPSGNLTKRGIKLIKSIAFEMINS